MDDVTTDEKMTSSVEASTVCDQNSTSEMKVKTEVGDIEPVGDATNGDKSNDVIPKTEVQSDQESCNETASSRDGSECSAPSVNDVDPKPGTESKTVNMEPKVYLGPKVKTVTRKVTPVEDADDDNDNDNQLPVLGGDCSAFQKPMQCGWFREIVIRGTADGRRRAADVYYFTPSGRKLRSMPQICDYLASFMNTDSLDLSNFTFRKVIVYKPPFEVVRNAGKSQSRRIAKQERASISPASATTVSSSKRVLKPKPTQKVMSSLLTNAVYVSPVGNSNSDSAATKANKDALSSKPRVAAKFSVTKLGRDPQSVKTVVIFPDKRQEVKLNEFCKVKMIRATESDCSDRDVNNMETQSDEENVKKTKTSDACSGDGETGADQAGTTDLAYKPVKARKSFVRKRPLEEAVENVPKKKRPMPVCGVDCPDVDSPPTLVCKICQRLFHHDCAGVLENTYCFCCDECFEMGEKLVNDPLCVTNHQIEPSAPSVTTSVPTDSSSLLISTQSATTVPVLGVPLIQTPVLTQPVVLPSTVVSTLPPSNLYPRGSRYRITTQVRSIAPKPGPPGYPTVRLPPPLIRAPATGYRRSSQVSPSPQQSTPPLITSPTTAPLLSDTSAVSPSTVPAIPAVPVTSPGATITQTRASLMIDSSHKGQLLSLPQEVINRLRTDGPIDLKVNGQMITVNQNSFVNTPSGVKILLSGEVIQLQPGQAFSISIPYHSLKSFQDKNKTPDTPNTTSTDESKKPKKSGSGKRPGPASSKKHHRLKIKLQFDHMLAGYEYMSKVFDYLELPDLLTARCVCTKWRNLADKHDGFRDIALEEKAIKDWPRFADFLVARKTETLDLTGLELGGKFAREWSKFVKVIPKLRYLTKISFGACPPSVLYAVAQELPYLESLTAEHVTESDKEPDMWYTNAVLDLGKLSTLKSLRELRLRGVAGLRTPNMAYSSLQRMSQLKQLRTLSLTSLKDVDGFELSFLENLSELVELEMGDCDTWTEETYAYLNAIKLQKLHLENGGSSNHYLTSALPNWQTLKELDLIMMAVDDSLARGLSKLTNLESLSICPDTRDNDALTNRNTLLAVRELKHLKYFLWCAVMSNSGENDDEMEFLRQGIEDSLFYGETGRPPPEQMFSDDDFSGEEDRSDLNIDEEIALIEGRDVVEKSKNRRRKSEEGKTKDVDKHDEDRMETSTDCDKDKSDPAVEDTHDENIENGKLNESADQRDHVLNEAENKDGMEATMTSEESEIEQAKESEIIPAESLADENAGEKKTNGIVSPRCGLGTDGNKTDESISDLSLSRETGRIDTSEEQDSTEDMEVDVTGVDNNDDESQKLLSDVAKTDAESAKIDEIKNEETKSEVISDEQVVKHENNNVSSEQQDQDGSELDKQKSDLTSRVDDVTMDEKCEKPLKKRRKRKKVEIDVEPRRSGRKRTLKRSDDSDIAFVNVDTLINILEYHLPSTDIRVDPIELMK